MKILIPIFVIAIVFLTWLGFRFKSIGEDYSATLVNTYTRSMGDLMEYLEDMDSALEKSKYTATSTGQITIATVLQESATGAKTAISYLPFEDNNCEIIENYLSVVADYAFYIEYKIAKNEELTEEDYTNFEILQSYVTAIKSEFEEIEGQIENAEVSLGEIESVINKSFNLKGLDNFDSGISELATELSSLPTMIYDGPFSDHIVNSQAVFLANKDEITQDEALSIAAEFAKVSESELSLKYVDEGSLAAFQFEGEGITIKVTKFGGEISYYKKTETLTESNLSYEEALEMALQHLSEAGYDNMKESYYVINDNMCTINFAPLQDDVILYPDLIKVTVELGEGELFEFSATGYLSNHFERENLIPSIDEVTCSESVSSNLEIKSINIAITPTITANEALCYEFLCEDSETGTEVLVYINGETGLEEQIYIILESETGKLVM